MGRVTRGTARRLKRLRERALAAQVAGHAQGMLPALPDYSARLPPKHWSETDATDDREGDRS